ncbi:MAG TPA: hypothetical protein VK779_07110, partial [Rhizomicrobium sp.]|nr:hypothetical protein [Rhizomicrobium sp.]
MATYTVIDSSNSIIDNATDFGAIVLGDGDNALITSTGYVVSTAPSSTAIYLDGYTDGSNLTIDGMVSGVEEGIYALGQNNNITVNGQVYGGISSEGSGTIITVSSHGFVSGDMSMSGDYSQFINDGTVEALVDGMQIDNNSTFINNGLFSSRGFGFFFDGDGSVSIVNTGTIQGDFETYYNTTNKASVTIDNSGLWTDGDLDLTPGNDTVTNTGIITGNVDLGDGNNTLDSRNGTIDGSISAGSGNDTILCGAGNDTISAGAGADTIDGGGGNNTMVYQ